MNERMIHNPVWHTENKNGFCIRNPFASVIPLVKTLLLKTAAQLPITQMLHLI